MALYSMKDLKEEIEETDEYDDNGNWMYLKGEIKALSSLREDLIEEAKAIKADLEKQWLKEVREGKIGITIPKSRQKDVLDQFIVERYAKCDIGDCDNEAEFSLLNRKNGMFDKRTEKQRRFAKYCNLHPEMKQKFRNNQPHDVEKVNLLRAELSRIAKTIYEGDNQLESILSELSKC